MVIVGHEADRVIATLPKGTQFVKQVEQLGTGHAVRIAADLLANEEGATLVIAGDTPLITGETLGALLIIILPKSNSNNLDCYCTKSNRIRSNYSG